MAELQKCPNEWCGALFKPGNWVAFERLHPNDTSDSRGRFMGHIPDNVCPMCRKPFRKSTEGGGE